VCVCDVDHHELQPASYGPHAPPSAGSRLASHIAARAPTVDGRSVIDHFAVEGERLPGLRRGDVRDALGDVDGVVAQPLVEAPDQSGLHHVRWVYARPGDLRGQLVV
jgi:hypothetical protein